MRARTTTQFARAACCVRRMNVAWLEPDSEQRSRCADLMLLKRELAIRVVPREARRTQTGAGVERVCGRRPDVEERGLGARVNCQ